MIDIDKEVKLASSNPRGYYDKHISLLEFETLIEKLDIVVALVNICPMLGEYEDYKRLHKYIGDLEDFARDSRVKYYYYLSQGSFYRYSNEIEKSLESYKVANKLSYIVGDNYLIVRSLLMISMVYGVLKDIETSLHYVEIAMDHLKLEDDPAFFGLVFLWLGAIFGNNKELDKAKESLLTAKKYFEKLDEPKKNFNYITVILNLGEYYFAIKDLDKAYEYASKAHKLLAEGDFSANKGSNLRLLVKVLEAKGEFEQALKYMKDYHESVSNIETQKNRFKNEYDKNVLKSEISLNSSIAEKNDILIKSANELFDKLAKEKTTFASQGQIVESIIKAIENNEITAFFQCKHSIIDDSIKGAEALVRWILQDGTIIPPNDYISYIDDLPVIEKVSKVVIRNSIEFCKEMIELGLDDFIVSINISPYQLLNQNVKGLLEKELALSGLDSKHIEVEITEQSYLDSDEQALEEILKLKELGVYVSLDDFGSGYASLASLVNLPFDIIKIDRSLVERIDIDLQSKLLFEGIVDITKKLKMKVIAEGVETVSQVNIVKATRCDMIQGYYYGKPMSAEDFFTMFKYKLQ